MTRERHVTAGRRPAAPNQAPKDAAAMRISSEDALVLVDIQRDFCPGGALAVSDGDAVVPIANRLMATGRFGVVVATQDWHPSGHISFASAHPGTAPFDSIDAPYGRQTLYPDHCVQETPGAELHPDLATAPIEMIVRKGYRQAVDSYSAFQENDRRTQTGLAGYLRERGVARVVLAGLAADVCVFFSAMDARAAGFETVFVTDATRGVDRDGSVARSRADMAAAGVLLLESDALIG